ncbi:MAG: sulfite exporter TauE/SafE family protein [Halobacteriaceae archaeon]
MDAGTAGAISQNAGLAVFVLLGVLGGAHCLGMCGPLVTMYADRMDGGSSERLTFFELRQHALFNAGRTAGYATVGAVMGALGALLFDAASVLALADVVRAVAGVAVGAFVVLTGARYLLTGTTASGHSLPLVGAAFGRVYGAISARVDGWVGGPRIVGLGVVHAVLPCPILYPAYLYALALGSPVQGALALAAVGVGTFPTLFAYGTAFTSLGAGNRVRLHRAMGAVFLVLGYVPLAHGLMLVGVHLPHPTLPVFAP